MLSELKPGDVVIVHELDRISRSTRDLLNLVDLITEKGASLKSLSESWLDTTSDNPYNELLLTVMAGVAQLERKMLRKRQKEGIALAKRLGKYRGRIPKYTDKHLGMKHAVALYPNLSLKIINQKTIKSPKKKEEKTFNHSELEEIQEKQLARESNSRSF